MAGVLPLVLIYLHEGLVVIEPACLSHVWEEGLTVNHGSV